MPQAKQQRQERELLELKIKAEREAMEAQLQLEANRQTWARVPIIPFHFEDAHAQTPVYTI